MIKSLIKNAETVIKYFKFKKIFKMTMILAICFKLLQKEDKLNPSTYIMWKENTKYRVFTDLLCSYADKIFRHEPIRSKNGSIPNEKIDIYLNSMLNY